ncbi:MAG: hypothetical protein HKO06_09140, partial [Pseudomonadales bacterium]|nr:hypothetical protein [Pseudomonadales bacterium]
MKMKQLTMAVAAASVVVSGAAVADTLSTALENAKVGGEVYGGFDYTTTETTPFGGSSTEAEVSDFDIDSLLISLTTNVRENVELGI